MALSKSDSIRKAQIPSLCHLCEDSQSIQWKCVDCNLLMCSKCKTKVHPKIKGADGHDVISLKDVSFETERKVKVDFQNIVCKIHKGQKVCLYCNACRKMVCPNCITDEHKKHDLEDLSKVYDERACHLEYLLDELKADLLFVDEERNAIEIEQSTNHNLNAKTKQEILKQKDTLMKLVESEATKILKKLEKSSSHQDDAILSTVEDNMCFKNETNTNISTLEKALNTNDIEAILHADDVLIPSLLNRKKPNRKQRYTNHVLRFDPGKVYQDQVLQMLGSLRENECEPKIEVVVSHKSNLGMVTNLYSCKNDRVLMCDGKCTHTMSLIQLGPGDAVNTIKVTKNIRVFDIVEIEKNEFVVSFVDNTTLKRLRPDGRLDNFLDLSPLLPRALGLTKSGKLLVSVREQGDAFPRKQSSERKLFVMTTNGKLLHEYNLDEQNKPLFSFIFRVTTGMNNDIYLIDKTSDHEYGSVAGLRYPNQILWRYSGNVNAKVCFQPRDITSTNSGNIVLTERSFDTLHVLNSDGMLKNVINVNELGIIYPFSLTIDTTELLWIGCSTKEEETTGAMIHVVKISGF